MTISHLRLAATLIAGVTVVTTAAGSGGLAIASAVLPAAGDPRPVIDPRDLVPALPILAPEPAEPVSAPTPTRPAARNKLKPLPLGSADLRERRSTDKLAPGVTLTTIRRGPAGKAAAKKLPDRLQGPWRVNVLTIDPKKAQGRLATTYGSTVSGTERTSKLAQRAGALAGVNGSFFSLTLSKRYPGIPVGLTISDGRVLSRPSGMTREVTLAVDTRENSVRIGRFRWKAQVQTRSGDVSLVLDKVNSPPAVPAACRKPRKQSKCEERGQLSAFTSDFARRTPAGPGLEVVLDRKGCALRVLKKRGTALHGQQSSLQATGRAVHKLRELAREECLRTRHVVRDRAGHELELHRGLSALTGRYRIVQRGKVSVPAARGGFYGRHARTVAGVDDRGRLLLVTIDGRKGSVGATLLETAKVAKALGMRDAVNLDGGGSTSMTVRGRLVNRPVGAERAVSDALLWVGSREDRQAVRAAARKAAARKD